VGLVGSTSLPPVTAGPPGSRNSSGDNGLGLAARWRDSTRSIVGGGGLEILLARPKMSLAAEATVLADPPLMKARFLARTAPGGANGSGPPIPAAPDRADTSEAIVTNSLQNAEPPRRVPPAANYTYSPS